MPTLNQDRSNPGYTIRESTPQDEAFLEEMLYTALWVPRGEQPFARDITYGPRLRYYWQKWRCQPDDFGLILENNTGGISSKQYVPYGAAWLRVLSQEIGFGYVRDGVPELSIALHADFRGQGLGINLLQELITRSSHKYPAITLCVSPENPAHQLYERLGFTRVRENDEEIVMMLEFR
jgi:GNAT superfamily N-acetyltransferase